MRRRVPLILLALTIFIGGIALPGLADEPSTSGPKFSMGRGASLAARGEQALRAERYDRAVNLLVRAVRSGLSTSDRSVALANLCAAYLGTGQVTAAIRSCDQAEEIGGATWQIHNNRGIAHLMVDRFDLAKAEFEEALELAPRASHAQRGLTMAEQGAMTRSLAVAIH